MVAYVQITTTNKVTYISTATDLYVHRVPQLSN